MNLPEFGVRRPITNLMIFCAILILSLYSLTRLGIDMMPEIEPPSISVVSVYPGASPEDVETRVTEPLENELSSTPGLEKITSRSMEGVSVITLKFIWGVNLDEASNDVRDRIDRAKRALPDIPDEMDNPFLFKFNTAMMPILFIGATAEESYPGLNEMLDKRVADPIRQIPGVGTVQVGGGLERQINVWIDRHRLEGLGFAIEDVLAALARENVTQPVGSIKSGLTDYLLRLPGEFASAEEIAAIIVGKRDGNLVYMRDLARVEDAFKEVTQVVRVNGRPGVRVIVQKQTGVNTVEVARRVKTKLAQLQKTLPADVKLFVVWDTSDDIVAALQSLRHSALAGALLVVLVTWFFLRRFRPSIIIAATIPFSILIAFLYLFLAGRTINVVSLMAMTISLGMVVDNAIVVVDNVIRHLDRGKRPDEAAIFGTREMYLAVIASTGTTVVVFLPLLFVSGIVGLMFAELSAIVCIALTASRFTATTFTPTLCSKWLGRRTRATAALERIYGVSERALARLEAVYSRALGWCLGRKAAVLTGFILVFLASLALIGFVGTEFIPEQDSGDLSLTASLPVGTRIEETDRFARRVEDILEKEVPERRITSVRFGDSGGMSAVFGGGGGSHVLSVGARLVPKTERKRSARDVAQALRERIKRMAGVIKTDVTVGNPFGRLITGTGGKTIQIEILGDSFEETDEVAERIRAMLEAVPGAVDVSVSRDKRRPELAITVDREKAAALGLSMRAIANALKTYIEGSTATKFREGGDTYDIVVRLDEEDRSSPEDLAALMIVSPYTGKGVRLDSIATIGETAGPLSIERQNRQRIVRVECNAYGRSSGEIVDDAKKALAGLAIPAGVVVQIGGEAEEQAKAFKDLTLLLLLGVALVYMVMAAQFESLLEPFVVMFAIPFTFTGVLIAFVLARVTLSVVTFLGIVMLMGIVVNNAIVLISYINILRARGKTMLEAVSEGGRQRLRPVLMTTITTIAGILPMALSRGQGSEQWQPLGITMIGGLACSSLVTLLFVPTLYAAFENRLRRREEQQRARGAA